jgi:hypothetical protein
VKIFFFEIGNIGYKKIENFMLISKMQTCLCDKMPPKKVKIKNKKIGLSKIRKQFHNFNLTFLPAFCHQDKFAFSKSA